jgi:uncharacterized surface protein with fasciclin (FAS1) repeats
MKTMNYKKFFSRLLLAAAVPVMLGLASCKEDIDESNLYTFTGETIEDFLANRSDQYSSFNYILSRVGYDKILSAYGTYTCFAPNNKAIEEYIDSLYDDTSNKDFEHNGMTSRGLEGLSDSLCNDIALYHLLSTEVMGVDLSNGFTSSTLLGRIISASVDTLTSDIMINNFSAITTMDNELENGVVHEIDNVLRRSNRLVAGELEQHPEFSIFSQALNMTGLGDSLILEKKMAKYTVTNTYNFYVPEECRMGYTLFAESDETLAANNINSIDELIEFANNAYARCADQGSGWYDYYRHKGFQVSTGNDYTSPTNALNMYVRYHILKYFVPYDKLVYSFNEVAKATLFEYYETMLPFTLMKVTRISGKRRLNRWVANSTLTDRVAEEGSDNIRTVLREGIEVKNNNIMASNGFIHPIADMLVYDQAVPTGVLNERLRFDDTALFPEITSNSFRLISDAEVNALNAGKTGSDGALGGNYIRIPEGFFDNLAFYNGENTRLYYLPGQSNGWSNYQGDEFNCMGAYDFAFRLPPVPDGTYELRMGYTANGNRGMLQFYLGRSRELTSMKALDIPLDMRRVPVNNPDGSPDTNSGTGWSLYTNTDDMGVESDANMHNLNWMRGPLYYTVGKGGSTVARANAQDLRRIITKMQFEQGEYWLRFKTVLPELTTSQFHLDYIELCPENVYNNNQYVEDMY